MATLDDVPRIEEAIAEHPLGSAIVADDIAAVLGFLARGADPNAVLLGTDGSWSQEQVPILVIAARVGNANVARALIAAGARINARGDFNNFHWPDGFDGAEPTRDALEEAAVYDHLDVVELLLQQGATSRTSALVLAATHGASGAAKMLLDHGTDPGTKTTEPLCAAIHRDHLAVVKLLVEYGAALDRVRKPLPPLEAALRYGRAAIAAFLIEQGAKLPSYTWFRNLRDDERTKVDAVLVAIGASVPQPRRRAATTSSKKRGRVIR